MENIAIQGDDDLDIFICGRCKSEFRDYSVFKSHKQMCAPSQLHGQTVTCSTIQEDGTEKLMEPLLGLAEAAAYKIQDCSVNENEVIGFKEVDAADVLISGFATHSKQAVFEVTVAPSADDNVQNEDVFDPGSLKIVEQPAEDEENDHTSRKILIKKTSEGSKSKQKSKSEVNNSEREYVCQTCSKRFSYHKDLVRHIRVHTGERPYSCPFCGKSFSRADKLHLHTMSHKNIKPYACDICEYTCISSSALKVHQMIHTNERPWKCQVCSYRSRNSSQLSAHLRRHTGDLPYVCTFPACKSMFKTSSNLRRHQKVHDASMSKPFACDFCPHRCTLKSNLKSHIRAVHLSVRSNYKHKRCLEPKEIDMSNQKVIKTRLRKNPKDAFNKKHHCRVCLESCSSDCTASEKRGSTSSKDKMLTGIFNLDRQFKCGVCGLSFVREDSLRAHVKMHSKDECAQDAEFLNTSQSETQEVVYFLPVKSADNYSTCTILREYSTDADFILMPVTSTATSTDTV